MNRAIARKKQVLSSKAGGMSPRFFVIISVGALLLLSAFIIIVKSRLDDYSKQTFQYLIDGRDIAAPKKAEVNDPLVTNSELKKPQVEFSENRTFGKLEAKVKIIYFSDYSCSFCQRQDSAIQKLMKKYPNDIYVVAKDYPSTDPESKSFRLSVGGQCAFAQGNFWEYKNLVYRNFDKFETGDELANFVADQLALKLGDFKACMKSDKVVDQVKTDLSDAENLGAFVVPFMKVNDQELLGEISDGDLERAVNLELAK